MDGGAEDEEKLLTSNPTTPGRNRHVRHKTHLVTPAKLNDIR